MKRIERKATKHMSSKYRCHSLTAKDKVKMKKLIITLKRILRVTVVMMEVDNTSPFLTPLIGICIVIQIINEYIV